MRASLISGANNIWGYLLSFLENFIIGKIESTAGHPDQLGWIKQALNIIAMVGSAKLEAYAVPKLAGWIESSAGNPIEHALVELAVAAIVKNGGELGKIVGEAEAEAEAEAEPPPTTTSSNAQAITLTPGVDWSPHVQEQVAVDPSQPAEIPADVPPAEAVSPVEPATAPSEAEASHDE